MVYQVNRVWVLVDFLSTKLLLCNFTDLFFHLLNPILKHLYIAIKILWCHLLLHVVPRIEHASKDLDIVLCHIEFLSKSTEVHTLVKVAFEVLSFRQILSDIALATTLAYLQAKFDSISPEEIQKYHNYKDQLVDYHPYRHKLAIVISFMSVGV